MWLNLIILDTIPIDQLEVDFQNLKTGNTKRTYPGMFEGRKVAVKVFRKLEAESKKPINVDVASRLEFQAYSSAYDSCIRPYVPEPLGLITDEKELGLIGLIVEWKAGDILCNLYGRVQVPRKHLQKFHRNLLELPEDKHLAFDSLSEANVGWDGRELWLAEPQIVSYESPDIWVGIAGRQIKYLIEDYT